MWGGTWGVGRSEGRGVGDHSSRWDQHFPAFTSSSLHGVLPIIYRVGVRSESMFSIHNLAVPNSPYELNVLLRSQAEPYSIL